MCFKETELSCTQLYRRSCMQVHKNTYVSQFQILCAIDKKVALRMNFTKR